MNSKYDHVAVNGLIKRLILVQHAATMPAKEGENDINRALTPWGLTQSRRLGRSLAEKAYSPIEFIFTSQARRTSDTMLIAFGELTKTGTPTQTVLDGLYPAPPETGDDIIGETYGRLGHVPYEQYQQVRGCYQLLFTRAEAVLEAILDHIGMSKPLYPTNCIVFGHVPLLPALAHAFLKAGTADGSVGPDINELQNLNLGEAEGVSLRFNDSAGNGYVFEHRLIP